MIRIKRKNKITEIISNLPDIVDGVINNIITDENVEIEYDRRLEICKLCEFCVKDDEGNMTKCGKCGCKAAIKLRSRDTKCPIDKW